MDSLDKEDWTSIVDIFSHGNDFAFAVRFIQVGIEKSNVRGVPSAITISVPVDPWGTLRARRSSGKLGALDRGTDCLGNKVLELLQRHLGCHFGMDYFRRRCSCGMAGGCSITSMV